MFHPHPVSLMIHAAEHAERYRLEAANYASERVVVKRRRPAVGRADRAKRTGGLGVATLLATLASTVAGSLARWSAWRWPA